MDGRMGGWANGRMDGWMDGRMDGWMDGWMDGLAYLIDGLKWAELGWVC